ncbi:uncharacterized protein Z519_03634 [Cladophialophora bantiana CBS 173.52]|uniref:GAF domain-containing protein n=1 Tax=Cladophialophora bantiana (strain ATCC 10958 / CBS 173.52 / CDC B-1940 / NIH 8579) TaxID=1442370 RepID=A0A0D2HNU8_CLAB1|nr:uncharacterized protein Z519_03634 [Cladophialophora bantiana CBS 173.52]KIW95053.1 hypothetical protein Z519_03634 [Cladophialophora bantiana CBS 173.52]
MALIPVSVSSRLLGVAVSGLNLRRHYEAEDEAFIQSLCRQASSTIALVVDREEAHERTERLCNYKKANGKSEKSLSTAP